MHGCIFSGETHISLMLEPSHTLLNLFDVCPSWKTNTINWEINSSVAKLALTEQHNCSSEPPLATLKPCFIAGEATAIDLTTCALHTLTSPTVFKHRTSASTTLLPTNSCRTLRAPGRRPLPRWLAGWNLEDDKWTETQSEHWNEFVGGTQFITMKGMCRILRRCFHRTYLS